MARRKSARFRCPHCRSVLTKSGVAQLLAEAGGFMGVVGPVTCPACGREIDALKMVDGEYDVPESPAWVGLLGFAWLVGGPFFLSMKLDWPLGWAIVAPWASLLVLGLLIYAAGKLRRHR